MTLVLSGSSGKALSLIWVTIFPEKPVQSLPGHPVVFMVANSTDQFE